MYSLHYLDCSVFPHEGGYSLPNSSETHIDFILSRTYWLLKALLCSKMQNDFDFHQMNRLHLLD